MKENMEDEKEDLQEDNSESVASASSDGAPQSELIAQQEKLVEANAKAAEYLDGWQRAQAEFANYKKRQVRDQELMEGEARARVLKRYLEIADDLELILNNKPTEGAAAQWAKSIELLQRKLQGFLDAEGLARIDPLGESFDANLHEAVTQEDSEKYESGIVSEVLRPGYMIGERVLRPASVKVAK